MALLTSMPLTAAEIQRGAHRRHPQSLRVEEIGSAAFETIVQWDDKAEWTLILVGTEHIFLSTGVILCDK